MSEKKNTAPVFVPTDIHPDYIVHVLKLYDVPAFKELMRAVKERTPVYPSAVDLPHVVSQQSMLRQGYELALSEIVNIGLQSAAGEDEYTKTMKALLDTAD